jgi:PIN domain nuclease of toxin-antitoxin system
VTALLLDTHVALWRLADDARLTPRLRDAVANATSVHLSAASTWEVAIKLATGKLTLELDAGQSFASICAEQGFSLEPVVHEDAWAVRDLPPTRADPFDRLIAATARRRGWTVVTVDPTFAALGVPALPA